MARSAPTDGKSWKKRRTEGWAEAAFAISPRNVRLETHTKVRFPTTDNPFARHRARHQGCKEVMAGTGSYN